MVVQVAVFRYAVDLFAALDYIASLVERKDFNHPTVLVKESDGVGLLYTVVDFSALYRKERKSVCEI